VLLRTRMARFGPDLAAAFGDFEVAPFARSGVGLFHLGERRFNAFRARSAPAAASPPWTGEPTCR
jgi:hypothetical protein